MCIRDRSSGEQNSLIDTFEKNEENQINEEVVSQENIRSEIPTGVSIESASYIESNQEIEDNLLEKEAYNDKDLEYTPKLFSGEKTQSDNLVSNSSGDVAPEKLFDQDTNEEEDFEIPAFLRRQKF